MQLCYNVSKLNSCMIDSRCGNQSYQDCATTCSLPSTRTYLRQRWISRVEHNPADLNDLGTIFSHVYTVLVASRGNVHHTVLVEAVIGRWRRVDALRGGLLLTDIVAIPALWRRTLTRRGWRRVGGRVWLRLGGSGHFCSGMSDAIRSPDETPQCLMLGSVGVTVGITALIDLECVAREVACGGRDGRTRRMGAG